MRLFTMLVPMLVVNAIALMQAQTTVPVLPDTFIWAWRAFIMLMTGVIAWFLKRAAASLDSATTKLNDHEKRISILEVLVTQHDQAIDRLELTKLVRKRYEDERLAREYTERGDRYGEDI